MIKNALKLSVFVLLTACASNSVESDHDRNNTERSRGGAPDIEEVFKMDSNGDGKLAKSEVSGRLAADFDKFDTNGDGFISREEFKNAPKPEGGRGGGQRPPRN